MKNTIIYYISGCLIFPLEIYSSMKAEFTLSENISLYFILLSVFSTIIYFVCVIRKKNNSAAAILCISFLLVIPFNLFLADKLYRLKNDADNKIAWIYQQKKITGEYPNKLIEPFDKKFYYKKNTEGFELSFTVFIDQTRYYYSSEEGWIYYSD